MRRPATRPSAVYAEGRLPPAPGAKSLRIATWNINSVRLRLGLIGRLARVADPDIICLQETKCPDELFPVEALAKLGYPHQAFRGEKGYNGVAILSRRPIGEHARQPWGGLGDSRHIYLEVAGGIELHNVYVPAGGDIPNAKTNAKFAHKLRFLSEMTAWWQDRPANARRILAGDLNVAPYENDVWSHKQLLDVVSHTPVEVDLLGKCLAAHRWIDVSRRFFPEPERIYSWWSYRNRDWRASDRGRRLDHIWVTPALDPQLLGFYILKGARDWPTPS
ncbi:MAG: endonuclease/exonuclease/phosphatase family protein, partial [Rhodospirillales bacterium]|nr:endonuclease/exonuclease/phosphatase family protein [Rhodospirillales bacterium]